LPEEAVLDEQKEEVKKPKVKRGRSPIVKVLFIVILAVASSAAGGVVSFYLISKSMSAHAQAPKAEDTADTPEAKEKAKEKAEEEKIAQMLEKSAVLPLEPFVVNLADIDAPRYLRIKINLMLDDKARIKELEENQVLQLKVRDVILQSLTSKTSKELINDEGKNKLRHEIQDKIAIYFRGPKLVDIMFTEFVIQL
jgi:flagellar FliL protein